MKALAVLVIFILAAIPSQGDDLSEDGPHLEISSVLGNLELERPSVLTIQLFNNATALDSGGGTGFDAQKRDAMGIVALLQSSDDRIKVLSGPQVAGTLGPGESRSMEFTALAQVSEVGIYPLQLGLSYFWLSHVTVSGDENLPDVFFEYDDAAIVVPLQAKAAQGPKVKLEELSGEAIPGVESELELVLANHGDEPALELQVEAYPQMPFSSVEIEREPIRIDPNDFAAVKLRILTEDNATSGFFALPCQIVYGEGKQRREDLAVLISVKKAGFLGLLLPGAFLLLILAAGYLGIRYLSSKKRSRRRL